MNTKISFLIGLALISLATKAQLPSYVSNTGLIGWWDFSGNANDKSGNNYHGVTSGAIVLTTDRKGNPAQAYQFDGVDDKISITAEDLENSDFTISVWVKTSQVLVDGLYSQIFMGGYNGGNPDVELALANFSGNNFRHTFFYYIRSDFAASYDDAYIRTANNINDGNWKHLVMIRRSNKLIAYLNGVLVDSINHNISGDVMSHNRYTIGNGEVTAVNRWFKGDIDDIGVWNRELTATEVAALFKAQSVGANETIKQLHNVTVFPVPATSHFTVQVDHSLIGTSYQLVDQLGRSLLSGVLTQTDNLVNLFGIQPGIYMLNVSKGDVLSTIKIIKTE